MAAHCPSFCVLVLVAVAGCSADLFHGTDWPSRCGEDPGAADCSGAGGVAGASAATGGDGGSASSSHVASSGSGGDAGAAGAGGAAASCTDGVQNQGETGIDCGGPCPACCSPTTYSKDSGLVSGTVTLCCDGTDVVTSIVDCGEGANHGVQPNGASCANAFEGSMNGGSCCVHIECATCKT